MRIVFGLLHALWLGGCLGYLHVGIDQFWIIIIPTIILSELSIYKGR